MMSSNYVEEHLPKAIIEKLEAGAFQNLCTHLQERSDEVANMDLMTVSGFCRNCLAKWMVVEARKLSDTLKEEESKKGGKMGEMSNILQSLDAMGYDEAAQHVYGMAYPDWKKRHMKKASDEQMQKFNQSKPIWATHDKAVLAKRTEAPKANTKSVEQAVASPPGSSSLLSNVCCQDVDEKPAEPKPKFKGSKTRELAPFQTPAPPGISFSVGILTVSDRASAGEYQTGDLSGPAVKEAVEGAVKSYGGAVQLEMSENAIVPDESEAIQSKLLEWADNSTFDLILTTGGTGFSPRDVTPEATNLVIERSCAGLITFCTMECAKLQPLSSLSRATAGIRSNSLIVNLPGNPKGVHEIVPILLPLALHVIADIKST